MLEYDISYLKGVGPARGTLLGRELSIHTYGDLLEFFPFRYVDRSVITPIDQLSDESQFVVLKGVLRNMQTLKTSAHSERMTVTLYDGTGVIDLVWFQGVKWVKSKLHNNVEYLVMGHPSVYNGGWQMAHPDIEPYNYTENRHQYTPVYSTTEKLKSVGLNPKGISRLVETLLEILGENIPETLPSYILHKFKLVSRLQSLHNIHFPTSPEALSQAIERQKFEELFFLQLDFQYRRTIRGLHSQGHVFQVVGEHFNRFYAEKIPFELTGAQKRVIKEIRTDMRSGRQMNRLLQGDVGSGKTLVALMSMLIALDNGCQACLMAPTEILATQHYQTFQKMLDGLGIVTELLTGSLKPSQKRDIKKRLAEGKVDILIGTHALIEDTVNFKELGLVVIDEQHRFGVQQRAKLWAKNTVPPHILVMTATPIPRTLAMTLYGDLECSIIDELPPGRQPVRTVHATDSKRLALFAFMQQQIAKGRQVYVVYPLINESESLDLKDLMDGYDSISRSFPQPQYQLSIVHGKMPAEAKAYEMDRFKRGETHIMVSTTVIEVGVDVPNATVMVIENAERFGLSQLHQLRGRVGRGGGQSYCILMTKSNLSKNAAERIKTMCETTDGFRIAEADLRLRGPGDIQGLQQSGILNLKMADIVSDESLVVATRQCVADILASDPELTSEQNLLLRHYIDRQSKKPSWDKIS